MLAGNCLGAQSSPVFCDWLSAFTRLSEDQIPVQRCNPEKDTVKSVKGRDVRNQKWRKRNGYTYPESLGELHRASSVCLHGAMTTCNGLPANEAH